MKRTLRVYVGEDAGFAGTLRYDRQGSRESASFEYDSTWLAASSRFELEPQLPLVAGAQFHRRLPNGSVFAGIFADTEPDGWARRVILRDHAKKRQRAKSAGSAVDGTSLSSIDYLLAVDDVARVGALRYRDEDDVFQRAPTRGGRTAPPLLELRHLVAASRAFEMNEETAADLAFLRGRGTSLGGMRPKCTIVDEDGSLAIGKFPSVSDERAVTKGEVLALRLARRAGIDAADARIVDSQKTPVAVIRRFDRINGRRVMYASAATMLAVEARAPEEHTYTEIADVLRRWGAEPRADLEELWRRIAFSILITNVDDHLRNHGFLHQGGGLWRLSPAFDLNPFPERVRELKTWISEEAGPEATVAGLFSVTDYFGIAPTRAKAILRDVDRAVSSWRLEGRDLGMTTAELDQFADAFEHVEREAAKHFIEGTADARGIRSAD